MPRNPLIAETLYKSKEIEKWGSGLKRIYDECRANKVRVEFAVLKSGFLVTFFRPEPAEKTVEKGSEKGSEKSSEKILAYIRANNLASAKEIAQKLGLSSRAIEKQIAKLRDNGLLRRVGPDKGGHWEVVIK